MIEKVFLEVINMSLTASIVIVAVILARLLLKKAPKIYSYVLWSVVLFRLLCPFSFSADFSLFGVVENASTEQGRIEYISGDVSNTVNTNNMLSQKDNDASDTAINIEAPDNINDNTNINSSVDTLTEENSIISDTNIIEIGAGIWIAGILVILAYSIVSFILLKKKLKDAICEENNIYITTNVKTPFVCGILRPRIYLPAFLNESEKEYILLHEKLHIKRCDHIIKLVSFAALCLHWLNPLVWAAFLLSGTDMEMSCDEAVIKKFGNGVIKDYSTSLLTLATGRHIINGTPLAFGEGDTGKRIKNILKIKKPAVITIILALIFCVVLAIILLANPKDNNTENNDTDNIVADNSTEEVESTSADEISTISEDDTEESTEATTEADYDTLNYSLELWRDGTVRDGKYQFEVEGISKEDNCIYSEKVWDYFGEPIEDVPLSFTEDCAFFVNYEMDKRDYKRVDFDTFADMATDNSCVVKFKDNKIFEAYIYSTYYKYGVSPLDRDEILNDDFALEYIEDEGVFENEFTLERYEVADVADCEGEEIIEAYTSKDGIGLFIVKDAAGNRLQILWIDGWENIYLGQIDGEYYLLRLHIEDRYTHGYHSYEAYRIKDREHVNLISGAHFDFGNGVEYDDALFRQWVEKMEYYLENSRLVINSQGDGLRTEDVCEIDKYNYDTLSLAPRMKEDPYFR